MYKKPSHWYTFFLIIFFITVGMSGSWLIARAHGYKFLFSPFRVLKTGVITVRVQPISDNRILLNNVEMPKNQTSFIDLIPGRYSLRIEHTGYQPWEQTVSLNAGQAIEFNNVLLVYSSPIQSIITNPQTKNEIDKSLSDTSRYQQNVSFFDNEVWARDRLLTRYSQQIHKVLWMPGNDQILVYVGNQIRIVDYDTAQDWVLVNVPDSAKLVRFVPLSNGEKIAVDIDGTISQFTITAPIPLVTLPTF